MAVFIPALSIFAMITTMLYRLQNLLLQRTKIPVKDMPVPRPGTIASENPPLHRSGREGDTRRVVRAQLKRAFNFLSHPIIAAIQYLKLLWKKPLPSTTPEVYTDVVKWNAYARQATMGAAEEFAQNFTFVQPLQSQDSVAAARICKYTSLKMVQSQTRHPEDVVAFLRSAFDACLSFAVCRVASFDGTAMGIEERVEAARTLITEGIYDILLVAGYTETLVGSHVTTQKVLASLFEDVLEPLGKVLVPANDFEIFIARPGENFHGGRMQVDDVDSAEGRGGVVVCTTSIGLIRRVPGHSKQEEVVVLKAQVLLESFFTPNG